MRDMLQCGQVTHIKPCVIGILHLHPLARALQLRPLPIDEHFEVFELFYSRKVVSQTKNGKSHLYFYAPFRPSLGFDLLL
jgi:hypothetical protein